MPIHQNQDQINRGKKHINCLKEKYKNVQSVELDLSNVFDKFISNLPDKQVIKMSYV